MSTKRRLTQLTAQGLAWSGSALAVQFLLNIVSVSILARILTPHDYGVVAGAFVVVAFGTMLSGLGLGPTLIQRREIGPEHVATATTISFSIAVLFGGALWLSAPLIARAMQIAELEEVSRAFSVIMLIQSFNMLAEAMLSRQTQFRTVSLVKLGSWIAATFFVAIPLAFSGYGYWALVIANIGQALITAAAYAPFARPFLAPPGLSERAVRDLFTVSLGFSLTQILNYVSTYADNVVVGRLIGPAALGIYSRSFYLISMPANMFGNLNRAVVFPVMSQIHEDRNRLRLAFLKGLSLTAAVAIPASAFLVVFAHEFVAVILGDAWMAAVVPVTILSSAVYFRVGYKACANVLLASGMPYVLSMVQTIYALSVVVGTVIAAPYGVNAVCVAVSAAIGLSFLIYAAISIRLTGTSIVEVTRLHVPPLVFALAIVMLGSAVKLIASESAPYTVLAIGAAVVGIPSLVILYIWPSAIFGKYALEILDALAGLRAKNI